METRAHHLLIGTFVLILIGLTVGFAIWLARLDIDRDVTLYDIYFTEAVSGLSVGNSVRFNGVPVGEVKRIELDPDEPSRVRVRVEIASVVPLKEDSVALLEAVGFTGVAFVQIQGGSASSQPLAKREGEEFAIIPSRPSAIQEVFEGAPDLLNQATIAVSRLSLLLNEENRGEISNILKNVNSFTGSLAERTDEFENIILNLDETIAQFKEAAQTINRMSATAEGVIDDDLRETLGEAQRTFASVEALADDLRGVVAENRNNLRQFTGSALPEATRMIADIRALAASLSSVAEQLEDRPAELIFPEKVPEYESK